MCVDARPNPQRKAIEVAADCAKRGETEAAKTIRNLIDLARAYQKLNVAYRNNGRRSEKALDVSARLSFMIE